MLHTIPPPAPFETPSRWVARQAAALRLRTGREVEVLWDEADDAETAELRAGADRYAWSWRAGAFVLVGTA